MFSFDKVEKKDFEKFQTDVQDKFDSLKQEIQSKATDSEETARTAANNAVAIEEQIKVISTGIESILKELDEYKSAALSELQLIQKEKEGVLNNNKELLEKIEKTHALYAQIIKNLFR